MASGSKTRASLLFNPMYVRDEPEELGTDRTPSPRGRSFKSNGENARDLASGRISSSMAEAQKMLNKPIKRNFSDSEGSSASGSSYTGSSYTGSGSSYTGSESGSSYTGSSDSGSDDDSRSGRSTVTSRKSGGSKNSKLSPGFVNYWKEKRRREKAEQEGKEPPKPKSRFPDIADIEKLPPETVLEAKSDMLLEMSRWSAKKKICPSKRLSMASPYAEVKIEYDRMKKQKSIVDGSEFLFFLTKAAVHGLETANSSFDLFGIAEEAEGYTEELFEGDKRGDVQECLEDICIEYGVRGPRDPIVRLAMLIFGGWGIHIADAKYRKKLGMDRRARGESTIFSDYINPGAANDDDDENSEGGMFGGLKDMARNSAQKNMYQIPSSGIPYSNEPMPPPRFVPRNARTETVYENEVPPPVPKAQQQTQRARFPPPPAVDSILAKFRNKASTEQPRIPHPDPSASSQKMVDDMSASHLSDITYEESIAAGSTTSSRRKRRTSSKAILSQNGMEFD